MLIVVQLDGQDTGKELCESYSRQSRMCREDAIRAPSDVVSIQKLLHQYQRHEQGEKAEIECLEKQDELARLS